MYIANNKDLYTLIIGILSYLYLISIIDNKITFVIMYLLILVFGFFFIKNNIFLYAPIFILIDIIKSYLYIEGNENKNPLDAMVEEEQENDDGNYDIIDFEEDDKKAMEDEDNQESLIDALTKD